jgi:hypothetical protein
MGPAWLKKFLATSRIAGLFFVALGFAVLSWSVRTQNWQLAGLCFWLTLVAMTGVTAPREDLLAQLLADRRSVPFGRFVVEPLLGAGLCLLLLWIAFGVLSAFGVIAHWANLRAAVLLSGLLGVMFGIQIAATAFVLRKKKTDTF